MKTAPNFSAYQPTHNTSGLTSAHQAGSLQHTNPQALLDKSHDATVVAQRESQLAIFYHIGNLFGQILEKLAVERTRRTHSHGHRPKLKRQLAALNGIGAASSLCYSRQQSRAATSAFKSIASATALLSILDNRAFHTPPPAPQALLLDTLYARLPHDPGRLLAEHAGRRWSMTASASQPMDCSVLIQR